MIWFCIIVCVISFANKAQAVTKDSTAHRTDTVRVTASRTFLQIGENSTVITTIPQEIITTIQARQVDEILRYSPGLTIQNYGGLGGLKTISLRGGGAAQAIILLDGVKLNLSQNGMTDLSSISAFVVENVEIQRGGASALYGGNAISGAVNINTRFSEVREYKVRFGLGSFNEYSLGANYTEPFSFGKIGLSVEGLTTKGNYPFSTNQFGKEISAKRDNSDYEYAASSLRYEYSSENTILRSTSWLRISDRGVPGAVLQNAVEQLHARLTESDIFSTINVIHSFTAKSQLKSGIHFRLNTLRYRDPDALVRGANGIDETYKSMETSAFVRFHTISDNFLQEYNIESGFSDLRGAMLQSLIGEYVKRVSLSASVRLLYIAELNKDNNVELQGIIRGDYFSDIRFAPSVLTSLLWKNSDNYGMRASFSIDFRPPNFNEMYYFNFGTKDLLPEFSRTFNVGIFVKPFEWCTAEVDVFTTQTTDKIIAIPTGPATWSARNIALTTNKGIELSVKSEFWEKAFLIQYNYTLQDARDMTESGNMNLLPYIPQEIISAFALYRFGFFSIGSTIQYSSHRFSLGGNQKESLLPAFMTLSFFANCDFSICDKQCTLKTAVENMADTSYSIIKNYPMPGILYRLSFGISL